MYKYSQIAEADSVIETHLDKIKKAISKEKHKSLLLYGSYAKGEGGFINGNPVNDYDLLLIGGNEQAKTALENLNLPIKVEVWAIDTLEVLPITQQLYEIKYGSILLSGEEPNIPEINEYDIPFYDALESLDKRVISMLVGKYEMMKEQPDPIKITTQICKMILALGDCILIKRGQFNPSYRSRAFLLREDAIFSFYSLAVNFKIYSHPKLNPDELWGLWNQVKDFFRNYMLDNQYSTNYSELLISYDERTETDMLAELLKVLGQEKWL